MLVINVPIKMTCEGSKTLSERQHLSSKTKAAFPSLPCPSLSASDTLRTGSLGEMDWFCAHSLIA